MRWINDSKATNGATRAAVAGVRESVRGRLLLLAGGQGKGPGTSARYPARQPDRSHVLLRPGR